MPSPFVVPARTQGRLRRLFAPGQRPGRAGGIVLLLVLALALGVTARAAPRMLLGGAQADPSPPAATPTPEPGRAAVTSQSTDRVGGVPAPAGSTVAVHVAGRVRRPGVVTLRPGARVADALEAVGGAADDADLDRVNLARPLSDGEQVLVPARGTSGAPGPSDAGGSGSGTGDAGSGTGGPAGAQQPVNLNTATAAELDILPGVGGVTAGRIIAARPFASTADLERVPGIGPRRLETLQPLVTV